MPWFPQSCSNDQDARNAELGEGDERGASTPFPSGNYSTNENYDSMNFYGAVTPQPSMDHQALSSMSHSNDYQDCHRNVTDQGGDDVMDLFEHDPLSAQQFDDPNLLENQLNYSGAPYYQEDDMSPSTVTHTFPAAPSEAPLELSGQGDFMDSEDVIPGDQGYDALAAASPINQDELSQSEPTDDMANHSTSGSVDEEETLDGEDESIDVFDRVNPNSSQKQLEAIAKDAIPQYRVADQRGFLHKPIIFVAGKKLSIKKLAMMRHEIDIAPTNLSEFDKAALQAACIVCRNRMTLYCGRLTKKVTKVPARRGRKPKSTPNGKPVSRCGKRT